MILVHQIGALGITIANPTDLVKVRLQAEGKLPPGVPRRYSGALSAYSTIVRQVKFPMQMNHSPPLPSNYDSYHLVLLLNLCNLYLYCRKELGLSGLGLGLM